jgi:hypothetical protein
VEIGVADLRGSSKSGGTVIEEANMASESNAVGTAACARVGGGGGVGGEGVGEERGV